MDYFIPKAVGNTRFAINFYRSPICDTSNNFGTVPMYCFLDKGSFCIDQPVSWLPGIVLSVEIAAPLPSKCVRGQLYTISSSMMLQILEILETVKKETDMLELETMSLALYSSSSGFLYEKDGAEPIDFYEARQVYSVVQEWKRSPQRITGTFSQYKPEGMTRHRFLNLVNQLYNCSAAQLIYDINMQKAMNMLLTSGESIIMVSELSGYTNKENFITAFRNTYGVTPGYLRKQFR